MTDFRGVLVKEQILKYIDNGQLVFSPALDQLQVQMHAVDLRLGYTFMVPKLWHLSEKGREAYLVDYLDERERFEVIELEDKQFFDLLPNESVVASTLEEMAVPNDLMAVLYPRTTVTRKGLAVDHTGIVDAGYEGRLLIPITNKTAQVIRIYPGERFCSMVFFPLAEAITSLQASRWHKKDVIVGRLPEKKQVEEKLILKGEIKKLKEQFAVNAKRVS